MKALNLRPEMTLAEFSAIQDDLLEAGKARLASIYAKDKADFEYRLRTFNYSIGTDSITFEFCYNDACSCHPEYTTETMTYTFEQINEWSSIAI
jgi:hypothetical protein